MTVFVRLATFACDYIVALPTAARASEFTEALISNGNGPVTEDEIAVYSFAYGGKARAVPTEGAFLSYDLGGEVAPLPRELSHTIPAPKYGRSDNEYRAMFERLIREEESESQEDTLRSFQ